MSWKDGIGEAVIPQLTPEEAGASRGFLQANSGLMVPVAYFEETLTAAACALDHAREDTTFRTALTEARNQPNLAGLYELGAATGKGSEEYYTNHGAVRALQRAIREVVHPRIGRYRLDFFDSSWRLKNPGMLKHQNNELAMVRGSNLSDDMKAILYTKMYLAYTSTSIKTYADQADQVLGSSTTPHTMLNRIYAEQIGGGRAIGGNHARSINRGFASHAGFYEALSGESNDLLRTKVGENDYELASKVIETALWLTVSERGGSLKVRDIRDHKLEVFRYIDQGEIGDAYAYLVELYKERPQLFSKLALEQLFGEDEPPAVDSRKEVLPIETDYATAPLTSVTSVKYCESVGLDEATVAERASALIGRVMGVITPETDEPKKHIDLSRVDRLTEINGNPMLYTVPYSLEGGQRLHQGKWRRMSFATAIASLHLGRFVDLGPYSAEAMEQPETQQALIQALRAAVEKRQTP